MLRKDDYIRMLEKRASDFDGGKTGPTFNHDVDNQAVGNEEHRKNLTDNRATLGSLFKNTDEAQRVETKFSHKWFPSEKYEKDTSSPLIKVAMDTLSQSSSFRGYPAHYKAAAIRSFTDELEKIAYIGPENLVGGYLGYRKGQEQADRGEMHNFGGKQVASLMIPGGAGYQVGRALGHSSRHEPKKPNA